MKEIIIDIPLEGEITITTKGFTGKACKEATASLEKAFGSKVSSDTPTAEAYQNERAVARNRA
jgi:hypothetical protein